MALDLQAMALDLQAMALDLQAIDACEIRFGARIMELLVRVSLRFSLQIRYVLIVFFVLSMPLKSVFSGSERHH
jgi:hypothetical protein